MFENACLLSLFYACISNITPDLNSFDFKQNVPVKQKHKANINLLHCSQPPNLVYVFKSGQVKFETLNNFLFQRIFFFVHKHFRYSICKREMQNDSYLLPSSLSLISFTNSQQLRTLCSLWVSTILLLFQMANCLSKKKTKRISYVMFICVEAVVYVKMV